MMLLTGENTFSDLKTEIKLQKTALSNHLTNLIDTGLILRPDHNKYRITKDGELFIRTLGTAHSESEIKEHKITEIVYKSQFSESL